MNEPTMTFKIYEDKEEEMKKVIGRLVNRRLRDRYIVMVGGAPVTAAYAMAIGADIYTEDAGSAALMAKEAMRKKGKL